MGHFNAFNSFPYDHTMFCMINCSFRTKR